MADFGCSDSGASLGDILGPAIKGRQQEQQQDRERTPTPTEGRCAAAA